MKILLGTLFCFFLFSYDLSAQTFAVIGDYGLDGPDELKVANLVKSWNPDFIITVGDNNYLEGDSTTIDENIGQYFHEFISSYKGAYGAGSFINRFFPTLGNHDLRTADGKPYFDYFALPGNERYYDFVWGNLHFFALHSDTTEVDGDSATSVQAQWLKERLFLSTYPWKIVYMHESPYSSGDHSNEKRLQWPFREWGATVVLTGHSHSYERLHKDGLTYIVNGLGGKSKRNFRNTIEGSILRYNEDFGAQKVVAEEDSIVFMFFNTADSLVDYYSILNPSLLITERDADNSNLHIFPNPFHQQTIFSFHIEQSSFVELKIYNIFGEEIETILSAKIPGGKHEFRWDKKDLSSGTYFSCLFASGKLIARTAVIIN